MRLKKHTAAAAFHSQLSAILEKLMVLAVEEMKELVFDFCEEISRDRAQNTDLCEPRTGQDQEERFDSSDSFYIEPQDASNESYEQMTQTSSREDAKETHSSEQNYIKFSVTNDFAISAQETLSPNCKFDPAAATSSENLDTKTQEEDCNQDGSKRSSFEPAEDKKDHFIAYSSPVETQSTSYEDFSINQDHGRDVECHIKQEEESPAFETGHYTGLQMQTGHMETGVQPIVQETLLINRASYNTSYRAAPVPMEIPGPMHTNLYIDKRYNQNKGNTRALSRPNKVLFKCEHCDKTYPFPSLLKAHYLKHTEGKQLVCGYCGKFFKWEYSLRRHEKMHLYEWKS